MNPLFFWSLAPSRSRPPRRVPLRRLRRFFVPISSDYDRFELPRIIENPAESGSIEGGREEKGLGSRRERERKNERRESSPSIVAPPAISTTEGAFLYFMGWKREDFHEDACYAESSTPLSTLFARILFWGRILESSFDSSIKEKKRFVERIVCLINFK